MKLNAVILVLLSGLLSNTALAAGEVAVFPVSGKDLKAGEEETIGTLFAQAYGRASTQQVLMPAETSAIVKAAGNLHAAAQALAVAEYVDIVAERKAGKLQIVAALFVNDGTMVHKVDMSALSIEDYRQMVGRLATALFSKTSFAETPSGAPRAIAAAPPALGHKHQQHGAGGPSGGEVAIFPVKGTNLTAGAQAAMGVVFAQAYAQVSGQQVLLPEETAAVVNMSNNPTKAAAVLAVAEYVLVNAVRLESKIQVTATLYRNDGTAVHWVQMTTHSLDDFQNVATRMAHALYHRVTPDQARTPQTVVVAETLPPQRRAVEWIIGAKIQGSVNLALGAAIDPTVNALFTIRLEWDDYFIEAAAGAMIPTYAWQEPNLTVHRYGGVVGELGFNYILMGGDISLYAGAGLNPRLVGGDGLDLWARLALFGQFGVMLFRDSTVRLFFDFRVAQNVLPYQYYNWIKNEPREFYPTELTLSVGFGF